MTLKSIGSNFASILMGEIVSSVSETITNRLRVHRYELGGPLTGIGSGHQDTLVDVSLDTVVQMLILMFGIRISATAMPDIITNLDTMIFFFIGIATQTTLPQNIKKITQIVMSNPDKVIVPNQTS